MSPKKPLSDPHARREAKKYDRPIPSREFIMDLLGRSHKPLTRSAIEADLSMEDDDDREALRRRLRAMERDGQVIRLRNGCYGLLEKLDLKVGHVQAHKEGYGFLIVEGEDQDIFLGPRQMQQVFDGDRVAARVEGRETKGRVEGVIVEVLERQVEKLVGRYFEESGVGFLIPEHRRIHQKIVVSKEASAGAKLGEYVVVQLTQAPTKHALAQGKVLELLGEYMAPGMEVDVAIRANNIPHQWSATALKEAEAFGDQVDDESCECRYDYREMPFITIDGEDARDFDDAVYAEPKRGGGWQLYVAIADVSHYVKKGSVLDAEARERATSVYFPGRVVPMLPEVLSNQLCSLNPHQDRLTLVCEMSISASGKLSKYQFSEGVIRSHARLTYHQVAEFITENEAAQTSVAGIEQDVEEVIMDLYDVFKALKQQRQTRGAIDFNTKETQIIFGPEKKIQDIVPRETNIAHNLIEEMMLCANISAAKTLKKLDIPGLYRNHEGVKPDKWEALKSSLSAVGIHFKNKGLPKPTDYQQALASIRGRKDAHILEILLLRSMSQAKYEPDVKGHFGLNYPAYAHFTSPIRRYPDLVVHRALRYLIRNQREVAQVDGVKGAKRLRKNDWLEVKPAELSALGEHCSAAERRADDATRDVVSWLKCEYMKDRIGEVLPGVISSVLGFGLFIELTDYHVEGLIHISNLPGDYYHFDEVRHLLVGEHTGKRFGVGDPLMVQVARVDIDERKIDFAWVDDPKNKTKQGLKNSSHKDRKNRKNSNKRYKKEYGKAKGKGGGKPALKEIRKGRSSVGSKSGASAGKKGSGNRNKGPAKKPKK